MHTRTSRLVHYGDVISPIVPLELFLPQNQPVEPMPYTRTQEIPEGDKNFGPQPTNMHSVDDEPQAQGKTQQLLLDAFVHLTALRSKVPNVGRKLDGLIDAVTTALSIATTGIELQVEQALQDDLEKQHEQVVLEGQKQLKALRLAKQKVARLDIAAQNSINTETSCRQELQQAQQTPLGRWSTRADEAVVEAKIEKARAALRQAHQASVEAVGAFNQAKQQLEIEMGKMRGLDVEEERLRAAASGDFDTFDPELGLADKPGVYVEKP